MPGARVAANLYRPRGAKGRLPAIVYVCGHSPKGKFHYQPHGRWFARHGYICLVLDSLQLGEIGAIHHTVAIGIAKEPMEPARVVTGQRIARQIAQQAGREHQAVHAIG